MTLLDPPKLINQPNNITIDEGNKLVLSCSGTGSPIFNVTWYKDNQLITAHFTNYTDVTNYNRTGNLIIPAINASDDGIYTCILTNELGSVSSATSWINVQCKYSIYLISLIVLSIASISKTLLLELLYYNSLE